MIVVVVVVVVIIIVIVMLVLLLHSRVFLSPGSSCVVSVFGCWGQIPKVRQSFDLYMYKYVLPILC